MPRPGTSGGGHRSSGGHSSSRVGGGHHVGLQEAHLLTEVPLCIIIIILHHLLEEAIMDIEEMFILVLQVV